MSEIIRRILLTSLAVPASWNLERIKPSNPPSNFVLQLAIKTVFCFMCFSEKKRRVYDQYGKEGLQMPGGKRRHKDDFDPHFAGTFMFRDPEEVFKEFFGGTSFEDLFSGK